MKKKKGKVFKGNPWEAKVKDSVGYFQDNRGIWHVLDTRARSYKGKYLKCRLG